MVATIIMPPVALLVMAYDIVATRYLARHVQPYSGDDSSAQIITVVGHVQAEPVRMPASQPQFSNALMVIFKEERHRSGRRSGGWRTVERIVWIGRHAQLGAWRLDDKLIENIGFDRHRASPCTDFEPPPAWEPNCRNHYVYLGSGRRLSYEITPIPEQTVTVIAATAPGALTTIEHSLSAPPAKFAIWAYGDWEPHALLVHIMTMQLKWMAFWAGVTVLVVTCHLAVVLRRRRLKSIPSAIGGGLWRALISISPLTAVAWPFDGPGFVAVALIALFVSVAVGLGFWFYEAVV